MTMLTSIFCFIQFFYVCECARGAGRGLSPLSQEVFATGEVDLFCFFPFLFLKKSFLLGFFQ